MVKRLWTATLVRDTSLIQNNLKESNDVKMLKSLDFENYFHFLSAKTVITKRHKLGID